MFGSIIKLTLRILKRNTVFSIINLAGLILGLACSILIFNWIWHEIRYDTFHEKIDHIFLLEQTLDMNTGELNTDRIGPSCGPAMRDEIPVISEMVRLNSDMEQLLSWVQPGTSRDSSDTDRTQSFIESHILAADSGFFNMFSFPLIKGDPATALTEPYSIVFTREMAEKYFGDSDPLDQVVRMNREFDLKVTGVVNDYPDNSSIKFDFIIPFEFLNILHGYRTEGFEGNPYYTFLYHDQPSDWKALSDTLPRFFEDKFDTEIRTVQRLLPFKKMHLQGESRGFYIVLIFSLLAGLVLIIACINFMNMSTAKFVDRTLEVGMRKVVGATRWNLIRQFMGETLIIVFIAINLAILLVDITLPKFNQFFDTKIDLQLGDPVIILALAGILFITGFIAGSYPAVFLSSFKPLDVIRRTFISSRKGGSLRKVLVVVQFTFSLIFVLGTIYIYKQYNMLSSLGYSLRQENVMYLPVKGDLWDNYDNFKYSLLQLPDIEHVSTASHVPIYVDRGEFDWGLEHEQVNDLARTIRVGYDFDQSVGLNIVSGRFYSTDYQTDSTDAILVNESVAASLGLEDPVGHEFFLDGDRYTIIGIVGDYSSFPVKLGGDKLIIPFTNTGNYIFIKTSGANRNNLVNQIEDLYNQFNPGYPFIYFFLEDFKDPITEAVYEIWKIILFFTLFGIFISCLGLLGLSIFSTQQRIKEISLRKVMGANLGGLLSLVNRDFLKLIGISFLIGTALSVVLIKFMSKSFYDQVRVVPQDFIVVGIILASISVVIVSIQVLRITRGNLASNLRYE